MKLPNITKIYALQNWNIYLELLVRRIWNINQSYCISPFLLASLYLCFSVAHENIKPDSSLAAAAHAIYRHSLLGWNLLFRSNKGFFFFFFYVLLFLSYICTQRETGMIYASGVTLCSVGLRTQRQWGSLNLLLRVVAPIQLHNRTYQLVCGLSLFVSQVL
jgi:hypothetical protein